MKVEKIIKGLPAELVRELAFYKHLTGATDEEIAEAFNVEVKTIKRWATSDKWPTRRKEFFQKVSTSAEEQVKELFRKRFETAMLYLDQLTQIMLVDLPKAPAGTKLDVARAISEGIDAVMKLIGEPTQVMQSSVQMDADLIRELRSLANELSGISQAEEIIKSFEPSSEVS